MKMQDLPVDPASTPWNRRVYAVCWAPFQGVWALYGMTLGYARIGFLVAAALYVLALLGFFAMGDLNGQLALGLLALAAGFGCVVTCLLVGLTLFGRLVRGD